MSNTRSISVSTNQNQYRFEFTVTRGIKFRVTCSGVDRRYDSNPLGSAFTLSVVTSKIHEARFKAYIAVNSEGWLHETLLCAFKRQCFVRIFFQVGRYVYNSIICSIVVCANKFASEWTA